MAPSGIERFEYDHPRQTLSIWFAGSGHRHDYIKVPPDVATAFNISPSRDDFFDGWIRNRYEAHRRSARAEGKRPSLFEDAGQTETDQVPAEPQGANIIQFRRRA